MDTFQRETLNARFIIAEHFDSLINKIDIRTEEILIKIIKNSKPTEAINTLRDGFISKINDLKDFNLNNNTLSQTEFEEKWQHIIDNNNIDDEDKLDQIKTDLIKNDVIILEDNQSLIKCSLWILNWFNTKKHIEFLKYI
jgi:hypothetical protein